MELWDAYDKNEHRLGFDLIRGQKVPEGCFHLVCEILVRHRDGSYLCMQRDLNKEVFPGYYETTAGGSALKGEDPITCAKRELFEETGLIAGDFEKIGYFVYEPTHCIYYSFLCFVDCAKDSIQLKEGETISYQWMSEYEFITFVNSENMIPTQKMRLMPYIKRKNYLK